MQEMYEEGYHSITNIDLCMVVIKAMQEKYRDKPGLTYKQMDGRSMELPDANFNVVIDKALWPEKRSANKQKRTESSRFTARIEPQRPQKSSERSSKESFSGLPGLDLVWRRLHAQCTEAAQ